MSVNQRLVLLRTQVGLGQISFSKTIDISKSAIGRYEKDGTEIPYSVLAKILEVYKVHPNWFFFGEGGDDIVQYQEDYVEIKKYKSLENENNVLKDSLIKYQAKEIEELKEVNS